MRTNANIEQVSKLIERLCCAKLEHAPRKFRPCPVLGTLLYGQNTKHVFRMKLYFIDEYTRPAVGLLLAAAHNSHDELRAHTIVYYCVTAYRSILPLPPGPARKAFIHTIERRDMPYKQPPKAKREVYGVRARAQRKMDLIIYANRPRTRPTHAQTNKINTHTRRTNKRTHKKPSPARRVDAMRSRQLTLSSGRTSFEMYYYIGFIP